MANFKENSRYFNGLIGTDRSDNRFLVLSKPLELEENEGDLFVSINAELEKRPDLLSYRVYGASDLWWVIYQFNGIHDPFFELKIGQILRVPKLERVLDKLHSAR